MNAYDFDGTVYRGDSSVDFLLFCWKKQPALLRYLPRQGAGFALYAARRIDKTALKERYFSFLAGADAAALARAFWDGREDRIFPWYLAQKRPDDVILSASPEFLLRPICERLGVGRLIASRVDPSTGRFDGPNCRGEEKVRRLRQELGDQRPERFYSDSEADAPLARLADRAFLVKNGVISPWEIGEDK